MKQLSPPRLATRLFDWYCGFAKVEDLRGDLEEWFFINCENKGLFQARSIYWKQVIALIFSYAVRKRKKESKYGLFSSSTFSFSMIENYLKVASRNIVRHKYFSIVNIIGLSIGMSVGLLLIALYSSVRNYDTFHANKNNIYRIISERTEGIDKAVYASAPTALGEKILSDYPGIKSVVRINSSFSGEIVLEKENIPLTGYYTDNEFLTMFSFDLSQGHQQTALLKPNTIVLNETIAGKIFPAKDALGKIIEIKGIGPFEVTGIVKDYHKNSHMQYEALISYSSLPASMLKDETNPERWTEYFNQYVYVLLPEDADKANLSQFLNNVSDKMYPASSNVKATFNLEPLIEITPGIDLRNSIGPKWEMSGFYIFAGITLLILLPACFNYTNISIARALKRAKEIGLRKTMGGQKNQIFFQFITETILITLISLLGASILFVIVRKEFQSLLVEASNLDLSLTKEIAVLFIGFGVATGLIAGLVPAIYFSGLNPIQALKSQGSGKFFSGMRFRKTLTVFQFFLAFSFIMCLVGFIQQYRYSLNYDFGFQKENILDVDLQDVNKETFRTEFSRLAPVHSISMSSGILGLSPSSTWIHSSEKDDSVEISQLFVDNIFIENFNLKLLAGKNFPSTPWQHEQFIIVNEEFLKTRKITNPIDVIGKTFQVEGNDLEVIGVVKNFHFASLQLPVESFFFRMNPNQFRYANLKVSFTDTHASITEMENIWVRIANNQKFNVQFFDDKIEEAYDFYHALLKIVGFLGLLAISISLLGLLGMVVYTSENKTKEVGIRKVMGATTFSITVLLSKEYLRLIAYAAVIAIPVTMFLFEKFVSNMQYYHTNLSAWDILVSLLILLILGLTTITSQTIKTASANPTDTLKYE